MDRELSQRFIKAVGSASVDATHDVVSPADRDAVVAAVTVCTDTGTRFSVSSHDPGPKGLPRAVVIALHKLAGIAVAEGGLTLRADAGAAVTSVRTAALEHHLAVVGLPASPGAEHVGTLIAHGEVPRRSLTGIEAVLPTGEFVTFGGAVLKDVVGYDLPAVLLGSVGRLAVITAAWFRLEPEAAKTPVATPAGIAPGVSRTLMVQAFDPQGLLQGATD
jgi:FAD/FMN-containing dehydrogenase